MASGLKLKTVRLKIARCIIIVSAIRWTLYIISVRRLAKRGLAKTRQKYGVKRAVAGRVKKNASEERREK